MNRIVKVLVGIVIGAGLVCLVGAVVAYGVLRSTGKAVASTMEKNPDRIAAVAAEIAGFDLPAGYQPEYALDLGGYKVAAYHPGDGHSHLMLIQGPANLAIDANALRSAVPGARDRATRLTVVSQYQAQVRGQDVPVMISEGTNSSGQAYRELTALFQGKGGPALVVIESPTTGWDQVQVDAFIASLR